MTDPRHGNQPWGQQQPPWQQPPPAPGYGPPADPGRSAQPPYPQPPNPAYQQQFVHPPRPRPNHVLHLLLTVLTVGAWSSVWIVLTARYWRVVDYRDRREWPGMNRRGGIAAAVLLVLGTTSAVIVSIPHDSTSPPQASSQASATDPVVPATAESTWTPTAADYGIDIKTLRKQCFGSAGCSVEVRLTVSGNNAAIASVAAELTVRVTGDETGPSIETISLDEAGNYLPVELSLSTRSSTTKVRATVTDVEILS